MCDPVSMGVGVAMGAASMAAQGAAQSRAAKEQNRYRSQLGAAQNKAFEQTVQSVREDVGLQTETLFAQQSQMIDAQKQQLQNISREARGARAAYAAITAETGVEGRSVQQVHDEFERDVLDFEAAGIRNVQNAVRQTNIEARAIYSRGQSIINQGYPSPLPPAARVDWGLMAVNSAITGINTGMTMNSAFKSPNPGTTGSSGGTFTPFASRAGG